MDKEYMDRKAIMLALLEEASIEYSDKINPELSRYSLFLDDDYIASYDFIEGIEQEISDRYEHGSYDEWLLIDLDENKIKYPAIRLDITFE